MDSAGDQLLNLYGFWITLPTYQDPPNGLTIPTCVAPFDKLDNEKCMMNFFLHSLEFASSNILADNGFTLFNLLQFIIENYFSVVLPCYDILM